MKLALILLLLSGAPLAAQTPTAAALSPKILAQRVDAHYNHLHTLVARYTERYQGMGLDRSETGTLTLSKPDRMRWAYDSPPGKLFLLDGKSAISYTPGDPEATRIPAKQLDDLRSPLRFLLGHTELAKELDDLTLTAAAGQAQTGDYVLSGVPKGLSQRVRSIALTVSPAGQILAMRLEEIDGAITTFTFTGQHEDVPAPASDFTFTPPPGVTIVNGTAPI